MKSTVTVRVIARIRSPRNRNAPFRMATRWSLLVGRVVAGDLAASLHDAGLDLRGADHDVRRGVGHGRRTPLR